MFHYTYHLHTGTKLYIYYDFSCPENKIHLCILDVNVLCDTCLRTQRFSFKCPSFYCLSIFPEPFILFSNRFQDWDWLWSSVCVYCNKYEIPSATEVLTLTRFFFSIYVNLYDHRGFGCIDYLASKLDNVSLLNWYFEVECLNRCSNNILT